MVISTGLRSAAARAGRDAMSDTMLPSVHRTLTRGQGLS